ncbi:MAG: type IV secretory system conjugative DNA transfer family protein [Alphaproteobacteria bacterium]
MPLFRQTDIIRFAAAGLCVLLSTTAYAQQQPAGGVTLPTTAEEAQAYAQQLSSMMGGGQQAQPGGQAQGLGVLGPGGSLPVGMGGQPEPKPGMTQKELDAELKNKESAQYKAHKLAKEAQKDQNLFGKAPKEEKEPDPADPAIPVPPTIEQLQQVEASFGQNISDDIIDKKESLDMRRDSQREAALSYGARGGLAKRSFQVLEELKMYEPTLDQVFNFRALLIRAPSGLLIEPPMIRESLDTLVITEGGNEAAVADQILKINKQAKIVTAPRDWRTYLNLNYAADIPPPPRILWPKSSKEQSSWNTWIKQGWREGYEQGEQIFQMQLAQLVADYSGMVRYRMLLAEGKISQPYALQEDRGVTGGRNEMRVGDRALRITGPSQFLTGSDLWKPADR